MGAEMGGSAQWLCCDVLVGSTLEDFEEALGQIPTVHESRVMYWSDEKKKLGEGVHQLDVRDESARPTLSAWLDEVAARPGTLIEISYERAGEQERLTARIRVLPEEGEQVFSPAIVERAMRIVDKAKWMELSLHRRNEILEWFVGAGEPLRECRSCLKVLEDFQNGKLGTVCRLHGFGPS